MELKQLVGRHLRLQRELAAAYSSLPWQIDWIDRLAGDIAAVEREIATLRPPADDQPKRPPVDQGGPRPTRTNIG